MLNSLYKWTREHWILSGVALYYAVAVPCLLWPKDDVPVVASSSQYAVQQQLPPVHEDANDVLGRGDVLMLSEEGFASGSKDRGSRYKVPSGPAPRPEDPLEANWTLVSELEFMTGSARMVGK